MPRGLDTRHDPRRQPPRPPFDYTEDDDRPEPNAPHSFEPAYGDPGHCATCGRYDTTHDEDLDFDRRSAR